MHFKHPLEKFRLQREPSSLLSSSWSSFGSPGQSLSFETHFGSALRSRSSVLPPSTNFTLEPQPYPSLVDLMPETNNTAGPSEGVPNLHGDPVKRDLRTQTDMTNGSIQCVAHFSTGPEGATRPKSREVSDSSERSNECVVSLLGLERELRKIWPNQPPKDMDEIITGLDAAINKSHVVVSPPRSEGSGASREDDEHDGQGRHRRIQTLDSSAQLRKTSPVKNLRKCYEEGDSNDPAASPPSHSRSRSLSISPVRSLNHDSFDMDQPTRARRNASPVDAPQTQHAQTFLPSQTPAAASDTTQAASGPTSKSHATTADRRSNRQRESKATQYLEGISGYIKNLEHSRQSHIDEINEKTMENDTLHAMVDGHVIAQATKDSYIAYLENVQQNLTNENNQLKIQLQVRGIGYAVQVPPPRPMQAPEVPANDD